MDEYGDRPTTPTATRHPGMPMQPMCSNTASEEKPPDLARKQQLIELAMGIAAQVQATTKRRERCMLRQMVEMFLDS